MSNENKLSTAPAGAVAQKTAGGGALSVFADGASFNTALRMAQCLASSTVVPKEYHGNVGNCMIAIEMASRINTSPMMVMQNLYIVNGRPAWSSQWIRLENLCWGSRQENVDDKRVNDKMPVGERSGTHKLTEAEVLEIRKARGTASLRELGAKYGVSHTAIRRAMLGIKWGYLEEGLR